MFGMARKSDIGTQQKNDLESKEKDKEKEETPVVPQVDNRTLGDLESDEAPDKEDTIKNLGELVSERGEKEKSNGPVTQLNGGNTLGEIESDEGTDNQVLMISFSMSDTNSLLY